MRQRTVVTLTLLTLISAGCAASDRERSSETHKHLYQSAAAEIRKSMSAVKKAEYSELSDTALQLKEDAKPKGDEAAVSEFEKTVKVCSDVLVGYEKKSNAYTITRILLGVTGAVAGGIAVPALTAAAPLANKAAISSLGGVSGVTSGVLGGMGEGGLDAADVLLARAKTRETVLQALNEYYTAVKNQKPVDAGVALDKARASCALYEITVPGNSK